MISPETIEQIRRKYELLKSDLNERARRHWAASEAMVLSYGGITAVHKATGIALSTICIGMNELKSNSTLGKTKQGNQRIRKEGGGRKKISEHNPETVSALQSLIEPYTRGDPMSPLLWTCKSVRNLADELCNQNYNVSHTTIASMLHELKYSLQSNRKTHEGCSHPDRNAQFGHINDKVKSFHKEKQPTISVDTKKKELIGNHKNAGQEWLPEGQPAEVDVYDFPKKGVGKAAPYGIYDHQQNKGFVNVGISSDTATFAVESIRQWWHHMGKQIYPYAKKLLITADCGGSNGYKTRLWKLELQKLADEIGLSLSVMHFPPGTSKWNKIEHRLFSFITKNWRGKPLVDYITIVQLIAATKTKTGLKVRCRLDENEYPKGIKVSDEEMAKINIKRDEFHGEWNYTIMPRNRENL